VVVISDSEPLAKYELKCHSVDMDHCFTHCDCIPPSVCQYQTTLLGDNRQRSAKNCLRFDTEHGCDCNLSQRESNAKTAHSHVMSDYNYQLFDVHIVLRNSFKTNGIPFNHS